MSAWAIRINAAAKARGGRELRRFGKFAIVGVSGFVVDFAVLNFLLFRVGLPAGLANACSFTMAVTNTFIWNRLWTFPESRRRPIGTQLLQFFLVNLVGLGINTLTFLGSYAFIWRHFAGTTVAYNLAKMTASFVALFWNFGANRAWTWRGL